jgi:hypothetical protein
LSVKESKPLGHLIRKLILIQFVATFPNSSRWSAVVRGAAAKGLEGDHRAVLKRKSRRHYGTDVNEPFKYRKHTAPDAYIDEFTGTKYACNQMSYLVKKGQDMHASKETHAKRKMCSDFWPGEPRKMTWRLLACNTDEAPQRTTHKVRN